MSYIDTFDHEFVGFFGGIPVYHPLEIVPALPDDDPQDFDCSAGVRDIRKIHYA